MQNTFKTKIILALFLIFSTILMIAGPLISSEFSANNFLKKSNAAAVLTCSPSETISGNLCLTNRVSNPTFGLACEPGYTPSESACIQFVPKTCADYNNAIVAEPGYCKYDPAITLYDGQILDYDGRTCNIINGSTEMWFLRYSVTPLPSGATSGPIVCATVFQTSIVAGTIAAPNFRFIPRNVTNIHNFVNTQTGSVLSPCPTGYTALGANQCSRPAISNVCNAGGEVGTIVNNAISCSSCPAGRYCKLTQNLTNQVNCPNGGTLDLNNQKCTITNFKYSFTSYIDGCDTASGYIRLDQSCAIKQLRDHDIDRCSYFFASSFSAQYAVPANPPDTTICSTGGSTAFADTDILKTDDTLQCNGPGSGWYNYNVAYDPLVCGNTYDPLNKAAFRWSAATFTKITGLQKLPQTSNACPNGWTEVSSISSDCYQAPITLTARGSSICPTNFYCPANTIDPIACPINYSSPEGSDELIDCILNVCGNGAINYPTCTCASNQTLVNGICTNNCTNGATNPSACNVCPSPKVFVNNSCIDPCANGATNPPGCNCPINQVLVNNLCVANCVNGAINPPTCTCANNQTLVNGNCTNNCINGATNPAACNVCPTNFTLVNNVCVANCTNGATNPSACNVCPVNFTLINNACIANCTNGATNPPTCNVCPSPKVLINNGCINPCANGAVNPPTCTCATTQTLVNGTCTNNCTNGATNPSTCNVCPANFTFISNVCIANCTNGATNPPSCNNQSSSSVSSSSATSSSAISSSKASSSSISSSSNTDCTSAQPGYYIDGTKCSLCQAGYYCPGGNVKPLICPIGYYCPSVSISATICPSGKTTKAEGSKDLAECFAVATVAIAQATTPRSGGNQLFFATLVFTIIVVTVFVFFNFTKKGRFQEWKKF